MLIVSEAWQAAYPEAAAGVLVMRQVRNPEQDPGLDREKKALEEELRARFAGQDRAVIKALPVVRAYQAHFKRFKKTYPVAHQLESVVLKGKSLPRVAALVEAMFMAELRNLLLTAGHDLEAIERPVKFDVAGGNESYLGLNGQEQRPKAGDMIMIDAQGVISSVLYGPDQRTRIRPETRAVMFVVYAPPGIGVRAVGQHLREIEAQVRLFSPQAETASLEVHGP